MRTIAVMNLKGGVAKTTTTVNVAAILAHDHQKTVLVIDADSQCNTTEFLGPQEKGGTLAELLRSEDFGAIRYTTHTSLPGVDLIAGSDELMDLDLTKVETDAVNVGRLRTVIQGYSRLGTYDFCLIDCPPAFNAASAAALLAADEVLIPIKLDAFSLRGMANLVRQIDNMREINPDLCLLGFLPTMWYKRKLIQDAEAVLLDSGFPVLPHIRRTDKADAMTFVQRPLIEVSPHCAAAMDYRKLVKLLVGKEGEGNG